MVFFSKTGFVIWDFGNPVIFWIHLEPILKVSQKWETFFFAIPLIFFIIFDFSSFQRKSSWKIYVKFWVRMVVECFISFVDCLWIEEISFRRFSWSFLEFLDNILFDFFCREISKQFSEKFFPSKPEDSKFFKNLKFWKSKRNGTTFWQSRGSQTLKKN